MTEQSYSDAIARNVCELLKIRMPYAEKTFGVIIGRKGKKVVRDGS